MKAVAHQSTVHREKVNHLHNLVRTMDLPGYRKNTETIEGFRWLLKNMEVKNSNHKDFTEAKETLVELLKEMNCIKG